MKKRGKDKKKTELMREYIRASGCSKVVESMIRDRKNSIMADIRLSDPEREHLLNKIDSVKETALEAIFENGYKISSCGLLSAMAKINYKSKLYEFIENMVNISHEISGWAATEFAVEIKKMGLDDRLENKGGEISHDELIRQYIENFLMELVDAFTGWAFDRLKVCFKDIDKVDFLKTKEDIIAELSRFYKKEFTVEELSVELKYYTSNTFEKSQNLIARAAKIVQGATNKYIESFGISKEELIKKTKDHKFG